ncbi:MAG: hypothetical protein NTX33_04650 [Propionibacteriales bacterium]|nr:hypothetical protein [Propionibacteriales bacterium]
MTEMLRTQLERVADRDFAAIDLDAITLAGDRRIRGRRRGVFAGAVVALVLACAATALVAGRGDDDQVVDLPDGAPAGLTWVVGDTLYTATASFDLGHRVQAYVRVDGGYAVLTPDGEVYSYVDGQVRRVGEGAGQTFLVSDAEDSWVGWIDESGATPAFVAHDLVSGRTTRQDVQADARGEEDESITDVAWFVGIDGGTAYWSDLRGTVAVDLESGATTVLSGPGAKRWVSGVKDGLLVRLVETASGGDLGSEVVDRDGKVVLPFEKGRYFGAVSPSGRWVTSDGPVVVELASGKSFPLQIQGTDALAYEWLDRDTVAAFREDGDAVDLLTCEVETGECAVVAEGVPVGDGDLVVPGSSGFYGFG